ncbi:MAG: hypothetical protein M1818_001310 [Claussenomyces sp. TS43310]|nr:MAG: hypothetical protein M1818_001310 [Claussenomyces sp. TS43310]
MPYTIVVCAFVTSVHAIGGCNNPGPAFLPIDHSVDKSHFHELAEALDHVVRGIYDDTSKAWDLRMTSFALQVTSNNRTIWEHYHTASVLGENQGPEPKTVKGDTAFRIASMSKTFTVYALLLESRISLEDPITKYLPELMEGRRDEWLVQWDQITIRSLASQLSGISRETGLSDLAANKDILSDPVAHGFPPVQEGLLAPCLKNTTDRPCTVSEILNTAKNRTQVFAPNARSTYSNVAFSLLGLALEKATGKSYSEIVTSSILEPLGMNKTYLSKPKDSVGIIPYGPNDWATELGPDTPTGGIYCTATDLSTYIRSILSSTLLPKATSNAWMKPHSWTISGTNSAYGMPWEILRTTKLTPDRRPIDIITKSGALTQYYSTIALIPELGLGVTVLVAGDEAIRDISDTVIEGLVPAADALIRRESRRSYAGDFAAARGHSAGKAWSLRLSVDETGPGLLVTDWLSNSTAFLQVYGRFKDMPKDPTQWQARLLPTGLVRSKRASSDPNSPVHSAADHQDDHAVFETWRLVAVAKPQAGDERKAFHDFCMTDMDALMYNGRSVEEFVLARRDSRIVWLANWSLDVQMERLWDIKKGVASLWSRLGRLQIGDTRNLMINTP